MANNEPYRRAWRVTFARGGAALALAVVVAWLATGLQGDGLGGAWHEAAMWQGVGILTVLPATWLLPAGMLADHFLSRFGATVVALVHVVGGVVAFFVWLVGLTLVAVMADGPLGGPFAFMLVIVVPPWMLVGFVVAWMVPGSFPRGRGLVIDGVHAAKRAVAGVGRSRLVRP